MLALVQEIYTQEGGLRPFYKGVIPNLILVANPVINFVSYESLKSLLFISSTIQGFSQTSLMIFLISLLSKSLSTFFTYPILTLRMNLQASKSQQRVSIWHVMQMVKSLGLKGLYLGVEAKFLHTILYNATMMTIYERLRAFIKLLVVTTV